MFEPTKKDTTHPETKGKSQQDGRRGAIMTKSNLIPSGWAANKLENNYSTEVLPLLWKVWAPCQAFQPGDPAERERERETRHPQGIWLWRPAGLDCRTSTRPVWTLPPLLEDTHRILHASGPRRKEQWPHRRLNQTLLDSVGEAPADTSGSSAVTHCRVNGTGNSSTGSCLLVWTLLGSPLVLPKSL